MIEVIRPGIGTTVETAIFLERKPHFLPLPTIRGFSFGPRYIRRIRGVNPVNPGNFPAPAGISAAVGDAKIRAGARCRRLRPDRSGLTRL